MTPRLAREQMIRILRTFERIIVLTLLVLMLIAVLASTIELAIILVQQLRKPPFLLLDIEEMLEVFGFFLMVLIGLELLETIKVYFEGEKVHAEVVLLVALVAVARKVIILEYKDLSPATLLALAAIIIALAAGFFVVKRALAREKNASTQAKTPIAS
jgi:uncharacterized membrane protein (DUF373 family)